MFQQRINSSDRNDANGPHVRWLDFKNNMILVEKTDTVKPLERFILSKLGFTLSQSPGKQVNYINTDLSFKTKIIEQFPHLCSRIGKSKNHIAKSDIKCDIIPTQHKGRRIPLHLTDKVDKNTKYLPNTNQIIKLGKWSDDVFISLTVITVKHDRSTKLALVSQLLNDAINKNNYQMQPKDNRMDAVARYISDNKQFPKELFFRKIDLNYAYSQIPFHPTIQRHFNFNIPGGNKQEQTDLSTVFTAYQTCPSPFKKQ